MKPTHFPSGTAFRRWLGKNHATKNELLVGFYNKTSGRGGLTYPEALDEALCFGWIDGLRKRFDADSYTIRFTPRKPGSVWSLINLGHIKRLTAAGRMHAAGLAVHQARDPKKSGIYSFENRPKTFAPGLEKVFRKNKIAWTFWTQQPPGYRRTATWYVMSAKQDATRERRLQQLITDSEAGRRIALLARPNKK